jgi:hypothetical protein
MLPAATALQGILELSVEIVEAKVAAETPVEVRTVTKR